MIMRIAKASILMGCALVLGTGAGASPAIRVVVDPRVELMSVVFRLAGSPEYSRAAIASYAADVDTFFGRFKDHQAVAMARRLREERGIGYNAPMALAVCVTDVSSLAERVPLDPRPAEMDPRWTPEDARAFLAELRNFVRDTRFEAFIAGRAAFYQTALSRLEDVLERQDIVGWFDEFFGSSGSSVPRRSADFIAALGLLTGGHSYGASVRLPNGAEEIYSILGVWNADDAGIPAFDVSVVPTVVHEFCHTYTNPLVDAHEAELEPAGKKMFSFVEKPMREQAYGDWKTMMYESLVRAVCVRFTFAHWGAEAAGREIAYNASKQFIWTGELSKLLGEYESDRVAYPALDAFLPRIAAFFDEHSGRLESEIEKLGGQQRVKMAELAAKGPKIVSTVPPNGSADVDPSASSITITFDRPMLEGNMALMMLEATQFPPVTGDVGYDSTRTILRIPVKLGPGENYGFSMNSPGELVICDEKGNPLVPTEYRFRTRK